MTFQRISKRNGATEPYDERRMFAFLSVNYGPRTTKEVMEQFKSGRRTKFYATYAVFEVEQIEETA